MITTTRSPGQSETRARIIAEAARLLQQDGPDAVTTRGVAQGAGVQAPAIYRLFGDKDGLLEAVAEHVMSSFVSVKQAVVDEAEADNVDALDDLRSGWQAQIDFGVANPVLFRLLSDPARVRNSPSAEQGLRVLAARVRRVAVAGRLAVSEERAVGMIQAAGNGAIQALLATPIERRDAGLADAMYAAVLSQILTDAPEGSANSMIATAVAFRAIEPQLDMLSPGERQVLAEWLDRAIAAL